MRTQGPANLEVLPPTGDVDGSGSVNGCDLLLLRRSGLPRRAPPNLLLDLDLDGAITALDLLYARRRVVVS